MLDGFVHTVVGDVVGRRLGTQDQVVTHVLLDEAIAIVAADNRVGQIHVFDFGLQLAAILLGDLATKMTVILFGWPMVRLASSSRSPSLSNAARRSKIKLSQNSTCEKN